MARFLSIFTLSLILISCNSNPESRKPEVELSADSDTISTEQTPEEPEIEYNKTYEGILPCAGCEGIKTTLQITEDFQKFKLTEEYLGGGPKPKTIKGNLNTERGFEKDKNATVYVLNHDLPIEKQQYYVRETGKDNQVTMLDNKRQKMPEIQKFVLIEVSQNQ